MSIGLIGRRRSIEILRQQQREVCQPESVYRGYSGQIEARMREWRPSLAPEPGASNRYDRNMVQVHMTEAEVASNFAAALEKVRQGLEVVVEHDHQAVAVLKPADPPRRKISECIAMLAADSTAVIDPDFAADVEAVIEAHREPLEPPVWD